MNSYFKQIIKEEIEKETEPPKYFILKNDRQTFESIKICEYVRDYSLDNSIWAKSFQFNNYGISLMSSRIDNNSIDFIERKGIIPTSTNYYDLINKNFTKLVEKEELIRTENSTEGYFRNSQIGDVFWVFENSNRIDFYIVENHMSKKLSFLYSNQNEILWIEKRCEYTDDLEFNQVNYIDRLEGLKLFKMYDLMENILKNIYDKYVKNE